MINAALARGRSSQLGPRHHICCGSDIKSCRFKAVRPAKQSAILRFCVEKTRQQRDNGWRSSLVRVLRIAWVGFGPAAEILSQSETSAGSDLAAPVKGYR